MKTVAHCPADRSARRQHGVGLVELMIAMVIGLFLLAGAVTVFMQGKNTSRTADATSLLQEELAYALAAIEPDIRMANFWGMTNRNDLVTNGATPAAAQTIADATVTNNCGNNWTANVAQFIDARDNGNYNLACPGNNVTANSDVLIIRRASANITAPVSGKMQIQSNRRSATIFTNGVVPATYGAAPASETHDLFVNAYYIGEILPSPNGNRQWALHRQTLTAGPVGGSPTIVDTTVIRGISDLQVQFGVDLNNDNNADVYVNPGAPELAAGRIVSVKLWLMALADDPEVGYVNATNYVLGNQNYGAFNDNRRRMVVQKTISLRDAQAP